MTIAAALESHSIARDASGSLGAGANRFPSIRTFESWSLTIGIAAITGGPTPLNWSSVTSIARSQPFFLRGGDAPALRVLPRFKERQNSSRFGPDMGRKMPRWCRPVLGSYPACWRWKGESAVNETAIRIAASRLSDRLVKGSRSSLLRFRWRRRGAPSSQGSADSRSRRFGEPSPLRLSEPTSSSSLSHSIVTTGSFYTTP